MNYWLIILFCIFIICLLIILSLYAHDIQWAKKRLKTLESQVFETTSCIIEYARLGEGYPILVIHGAFGGFDQGLWLANSFGLKNYQLIAISRFGYLRSSLPENANLNLQADAFANLLDSLNIHQVVVFGVSSGSTSAIRFVARYPDRVSAMILIGPDSPGNEYMTMPPRFILNILLRSDFIYWLWVKLFWKSMQSTLNLVPAGYNLTSENIAQLKKVQLGDLPVSWRMDGLVYESYDLIPEFFESVTADSPYPLEKIDTPVLVIHALDDAISLPTNVRALAEKIPKASLFSVKEGGHFFFGHVEEVKFEIAQFLQNKLFVLEKTITLVE